MPTIDRDESMDSGLDTTWVSVAAELVKAVAEMRQYGEGETARRQQLENSLQEATSLFKRELAAKNTELADLHAELGYPPPPPPMPRLPCYHRKTRQRKRRGQNAGD